MADIDVERRGTSIWPWIIGLIILALLLWLLFALLDDDGDEVAVEEPVAAPVIAEPAAPDYPPAVEAYMTSCTDEMGQPQGEMGLEHDYSVSCLQELGNSLDALIAQQTVSDTDVSTALEDYRGTVQQLQASDESSMSHADLTRNAAMSASALMQAMNNAYFDGEAAVATAVGEAGQAAEGIRPGVAMLDQRDSVQSFFREAGDALRAMVEHFAMAAPA